MGSLIPTSRPQSKKHYPFFVLLELLSSWGLSVTVHAGVRARACAYRWLIILHGRPSACGHPNRKRKKSERGPPGQLIFKQKALWLFFSHFDFFDAFFHAICRVLPCASVYMCACSPFAEKSSRGNTKIHV